MSAAASWCSTAHDRDAWWSPPRSLGVGLGRNELVGTVAASQVGAQGGSGGRDACEPSEFADPTSAAIRLRLLRRGEWPAARVAVQLGQQFLQLGGGLVVQRWQCAGRVGAPRTGYRRLGWHHGREEGDLVVREPTGGGDRRADRGEAGHPTQPPLHEGQIALALLGAGLFDQLVVGGDQPSDVVASTLVQHCLAPKRRGTGSPDNRVCPPGPEALKVPRPGCPQQNLNGASSRPRL